MLYVPGDAGHKSIPVFKVGVKISLQKDRRGQSGDWGLWRVVVTVCVRVYLVHDRGGRRFDAWLLVGQGQLLQQVHVGQSIFQGHVGRHGNK